MNVNTNYSHANISEACANVTYRGKQLSCSDSQVASQSDLCNNRDDVIAQKINTRKIYLINSLVYQYNSVVNLISDNDIKNDMDLYFLGCYIKLNIDDNTLYKMLIANDIKIAANLLADQTIDNKNILASGLYNLTMASVTKLTNTVFSVMNHLQYDHTISKITKMHETEIATALNIGGIRKQHSIFRDIDFKSIINSFYQNFNCNYLTLVKALYVGTASAWMQMVTATTDSSALDNFEDIAKARIINNVIETLQLDQQLEYFRNNVVNANKHEVMSAAFKGLIKDVEKISNSKEMRIYKNDNYASRDDEYLQKLTSLATGFYFISCQGMKDRNKISINAASGIIKIGATRNHLFKYTYYQPLSELEYTTESADDFLKMLKKMFFQFSFYSLENKDDVLILQTFNEMLEETKTEKEN